MRSLIRFGLFITLFSVGVGSAGSFSNAEEKTATPDRPRTPVLVELFTSEGCFTCPNAEAYLAKMQRDQPFKDVELITMALHVDYWDAGGWKDKFSSPLYTQRQSAYGRKFRNGRVFTPQMVVDGERAFEGSNEKAAKKAIKIVAKNIKAGIQISTSEDRMSVSIPQIGEHENSTIYLAYLEDNLSTSVGGGENAGKKLTHLSVVRRLKALGSLASESRSFETETQIDHDPNWKKENIDAVVFIQEKQSRKILGVSRVKLYPYQAK